jgi:hypothetical protein
LHLHDHFDHGDQLSAEPHAQHDSLFSDSNSSDRLDWDIQCSYLHFRSDTAIAPPATQVGLFAGGGALNESPLASIAQSETEDLWLRSVFKRFLSFPDLRDLSRHLFFSVLRI